MEWPGRNTQSAFGVFVNPDLGELKSIRLALSMRKRVLSYDAYGTLNGMPVALSTCRLTFGGGNRMYSSIGRQFFLHVAYTRENYLEIECSSRDIQARKSVLCSAGVQVYGL